MSKKNVTKRYFRGESISLDTRYEYTLMVSSAFAQLEVLGGLDEDEIGDTFVLRETSEQEEAAVQDDNKNPDNAAAGNDNDADSNPSGSEWSLRAEPDEDRMAFRTTGGVASDRFDVIRRQGDTEDVLARGLPRDTLLNEPGDTDLNDPTTAARFVPVRFYTCEPDSSDTFPSAKTPWLKDAYPGPRLRQVPEADDSPDKAADDDGSDEEPWSAPEPVTDRYIYHIRKATSEPVDNASPSGHNLGVGNEHRRVEVTAFAHFADEDGILNPVRWQTGEHGHGAFPHTVILAESSWGATYDHFFWLSRVPLPAREVERLTEVVETGATGRLPLTRLQVTEETYPRADDHQAGGLVPHPDEPLTPLSRPKAWNGMGVFLIDYADWVEQCRRDVRTAFERWNKWKQDTAQTRMYAHTLGRTTYEFDGFQDGQVRRAGYLPDQIMRVEADEEAYDMTRAWSGHPAVVAGSMRTHFMHGGRRLFSGSDLEEQPDALAQWLLGYQNKEEQLYGTFEAASQRLADWFDHRGVQMAMAQVNALMEAIAAGDAPYAVEDEEASIEQTVQERVAALEDLALSEIGIQKIMEMYRSSDLRRRADRYGSHSPEKSADEILLEPIQEAYEDAFDQAGKILAPPDGLRLTFKLARKSLKAAFSTASTVSAVIPSEHGAGQESARMVAALLNGSLLADAEDLTKAWKIEGSAFYQDGALSWSNTPEKGHFIVDVSTDADGAAQTDAQGAPKRSGSLTKGTPEYRRPETVVQPNGPTKGPRVGLQVVGERPVKTYRIRPSNSTFLQALHNMEVPAGTTLDLINVAFGVYAFMETVKDEEEITAKDLAGLGFVMQSSMQMADRMLTYNGVDVRQKVGGISRSLDDALDFAAKYKVMGALLTTTYGVVAVDDALERNETVEAYAEATYAVGGLALMYGSSLGTMVLGTTAVPVANVIGWIFLFVSGTLFYIDYRQDQAQLKAADPLYRWLATSLFGKDGAGVAESTPLEQPVQDQTEAVVDVNLSNIFSLVRPEAYLDSLPPRPDPEPLARETRQFVENAFVFPVEVGVVDRIQPVIQNPYSEPPGTTPDLPERRRVTGVTLEITPEYMPAAATLVIDAKIDSPKVPEPGRIRCRVHFVRIDENSLRYCVTALDEPIPTFSKETVDTWAWATDTLTIGLRADPVPGDGPRTAVRVAGLRKILNATETYTVQRTEGFFGSYTITAPSFTVVGNAYFFPLTPLRPPEDVLRAIWPSEPDAGLDPTDFDATGPGNGTSSTSTNSGVGVDLGGSGDGGTTDSAHVHENALQQPPMHSNARIRHAYPHYDVEKGAFPDPLSSR